MVRKVNLLIIFLLAFSLKTKEQIITFMREPRAKVIEVNNRVSQRDKMLNAIIQVESNGNVLSYNEKEEAAGILQIRPIMLREVNRIIGVKAFKLEDRFDSLKSIHMFMIFQRKYNPEMDLEIASRIWNGGQNGMRKESTIVYFEKVKKQYEISVMSKKGGEGRKNPFGTVKSAKQKAEEVKAKYDKSIAGKKVIYVKHPTKPNCIIERVVEDE